MKRRTVIVAGERVEVSWSETENAVAATVNGRHYEIDKRRIDSDTLWFGVDGISIEASVAPTEAGCEVSVQGNRISVEFVDSQRKSRRQGSVADGLVALRAPMPGKIVRILVAEGAEVEAHQGIVVMEAMKMQNEIRAPKKGKVVELKVREGDAVKLGDLIAQVE